MNELSVLANNVYSLIAYVSQVIIAGGFGIGAARHKTRCMVRITAYTVVQAVVKANRQSNENGQISTPTAPKALNGFQ